jgi:hypothetical protein
MNYMQYEISPQMRILAKQLESERRKNGTDLKSMLNNTSTETQTSNRRQVGIEFSWNTPDADYREGFPKDYKSHTKIWNALNGL